MQTSKSVQLVDGNNVNISPMTDLMSLYYEVMTDDGIIARKYIYNDFPYGVVYQNMNYNNIGKVTSSGNILSIQNDEKICYDKGNNTYCDIFVSDVSVYKLSGTNYNVINSNTYNLSDILFHYESKYAFNSSYNELKNYAVTLADNNDTYFNNIKTYIDTSINDLSTKITACNSNISNINLQINTILQTYNTQTTYNYSDLLVLINAASLVVNKIYPVIYKPSTSNHNINQSQVNLQNSSQYPEYIFYLKATAPNKLDLNVQHVCAKDNQNNIFNLSWNIQYDINTNKIVWMKDEYGNEAPYDFKHAIININNHAMHTFTDSSYNDMSLSGKIQNNVIYSDSSIVQKMPIIYCVSTAFNNNIDTDSSILLAGYEISGNDIQNSIINCDYTVQLTQEDIKDNIIQNSQITYLNILNSAILNNKIINTIIDMPLQSELLLYEDNIYNSSIYCNQISQYVIEQCIINQSELSLIQSYPNITNNIINGIDNKIKSSMQWNILQYNNKFITSQDMYAQNFIQI